MHTTARALATIVLTVVLGLTTSLSRAADSEPFFGLNVLSNGGFEHDCFNTRPEVMGCPLQPRLQFGQADSLPDGWNLDGCGRVAGGHSGHYALRIDPGKVLSRDGIGYAVLTRAGLKPPPLRLSAWIKADQANSSLTATVELTMSAVKEFTVKKELAVPGTAAWKRCELDLSAADVTTALEKLDDKGLGAITAKVAFRVAKDAAPVLIDDVRLERPYTPPAYSLLTNPGFEKDGTDGWAEGWSRARKSMRHIGNWYYVWRSWYHFMSVPRGADALDGMVVLGGKRSLRLNLPPGDHKHIESDAVPLQQSAPTRMAVSFDYNSYLLDTLFVQVIDQDGREVFFEYVQPGTTGGWQTFQAVFTPAPIDPKTTPGGVGVPAAAGQPVALKSCRVRIGVRGVNGSNHDDVNEWINVNHAGVVWLDNVALMEVDPTPDDLKKRGLTLNALEGSTPGLVVESIDLGERLFGQNTATVTLLNMGGSAAAGTLAMTVDGPFREDDPQKAGYAIGAVGQETVRPAPEKAPEQKTAAPFAVPAGQRTTVGLNYTIPKLAVDWQEEYRVHLGLDEKRATDLTFGTWSQAVLVEIEKIYSFPDETKQTVSLNFGVGRAMLEKTQSVQVEVRRALDDGAVIKEKIEDFATLVKGFNLVGLPKDWQGDSTNFHQLTLDVSKLPVHAQTQPVRDHYVSVRGLDAAGHTTFDGKSPRFGRMEVHNEKLEAIAKVEVSPDNHLVINEKAFFNRGHLQMQQNFGPSPSSHQPMDFKKTGFNTGGVGRRNDDKMLKSLWDEQNLYVITQTVQTKPPLTDAVKADVLAQIKHPGIIGLNYVQWEGAPEGGSDEERIKYARDLKALMGGRPLWISAGWFSPTVNGTVYPDYLEHSLFAPENNAYFQPSQLDREVLAKKRARGEPAVLNTYPNTFNDMPYGVQRFELWTEIIRGHTGYTIIGMPGDPTLYRGMNGEVRFMESFLFSKEKPPEVTVSPLVEHLVRSRGDKTYVLASNAGPIIGGDWKWNREVRDRGVASHTGDAFWNRLHPFMKDYHVHFYKDDRPTMLRKGDKLVQYVLVPEKAKAEALVLMVRGDGDWKNHAVWGQWDHQAFTDSGVRLWLGKDVHQMFWGTVGFCGPDGGDPKNPQLLKYVFTENEFRRLGDAPAAGKWVRLEADAAALGLDGKTVDGFGFLSKGDNVFWERTLLVRDGQETVLCDGSAGVPPENLRAVRFSVPGLKAGTKIKVTFEERELIAGDGFFEDDLTGEPGYRNLWVGVYGDKIGATGYYGDGVTYNYNFGRVAARLYELPR